MTISSSVGSAPRPPTRSGLPTSPCTAPEGKLYLCAIKGVYSNSDRGLLHRLPDEVHLGPGYPGSRRAAALTGGDNCPLRQGRSVSITKFAQALSRKRLTRIDGPRRCIRRQSRHGVVLRPAATQRPRPATLDTSSRTPPGNRDLGWSGPTTDAGPNARLAGSPRQNSNCNQRPEPARGPPRPRENWARPTAS